MNTALVWFRRDLRLADNPALDHALRVARRVIPVFIDVPAESEGGWAPGAASRWWLHHSLNSLDAALRQRGVALVIRQGDPLWELRTLVRETGAQAVFWNRRYEPAWIGSDRMIGESLLADGLEARAFSGQLLVEPREIRTGAGGPYRVYTPFARAARAVGMPRQPLPEPDRMNSVQVDGRALDELRLRPQIDWAGGLAAVWTPGEDGAHAQLDRFCEAALADYAEGRDRPGEVLTSRLSPHLHFGEISPVQIMARLQRESFQRGAAGSARGREVFERELYWREFAYHLLQHFPNTPERPLNARFEGFRWRTPEDYAGDLNRWQRGQTGVPIVDAGMRELWTTGWMHNRVRMIAASFLVKNLLIPWREGARWFWNTLVDADLANNTLGWQWVAGCGADAAPYFRIFNPVTQSRKFDPGGTYLRRWLPELALLPDAALHAPWESDAQVLRRAGIQLGREYPLPVTDLGISRQRALDRFAALKS